MLAPERLHTQLNEKIEHILACSSQADQAHPLSLMGGSAGKVLFCFYMARMRQSQAWHDRAFEVLNSIFNHLEAEGVGEFTYCNGIAGFGVLLHHLVEHDFLEIADDSLLAQMDELVIGDTRQLLARHQLDFLHGAVGNAFYLLKRKGNPSTDSCLLALMDYLQNTAIRDEQGLRWYDPPLGTNGSDPKSVNLSLSHGLCSKIRFFTACIAKGVQKERTTDLLHGSVEYVLNQKDAAAALCTYPAKIIAGQRAYVNRLAWCYGDLGVAMTLLRAGQTTQNQAWIGESIDVATKAARRISPPETRVMDAGFCHGAAGVAHLYGRLFLETHDPAFQTARHYWLEQALQMATFNDGLAGYKVWQEKAWVTDHFLLEGLMGIGLVLQSSLTHQPANLAWDELFLLS